MSGFEIGSLALGIVPVLLELVTVFQRTRETFRSFDGFEGRLSRLRIRFNSGGVLFRNECRLLLRLVVDEQQLEEMIQDPFHRLWEDESLDSRLRMYVGDICDDLKDNLIVIREMLFEVSDGLTGYLDKLKAQGSQHIKKDGISSQFQKLKFSVIDESKYKEKLDELHRWLASLNTLCVQIRELREQRPAISKACLTRRRLPQIFSTAQKTSSNLHSILTDTWTCANFTHTNHIAKLNVNAADDSEANLHLTILFSERHQREGTVDESPICVRVHMTQSGVPPKAQGNAGYLQQELGDLPRLPGAPRPNPCAFTTSNNQGKSKKRVRFFSTSDGETHEALEESQQRNATPLRSQHYEGSCYSTYDLNKSVEGICNHLTKAGAKQPNGSKGSCLGYLENEFELKLVFYDAGHEERSKTIRTLKDAVPLKRVLTTLDKFHQLKLALQVSTAFLKFHSTKWLREDWRLQDMAFFGRLGQVADEETFEELKTLHLSTQIPNKLSNGFLPDPMAYTETYPSVRFNATGDSRVRNLSLGHLAIALLEIGFKKDIGRLRKRSEISDLTTARELADASQPLGLAYQKIIRKCIHCDFAFGSDLSSEELQDAVYSDVVCSLENIVKSCQSLEEG
ncbi:uncharacterized protein BDR25DRAFT_260781 [Lindgomyces ingoldianus]|uniref:Uncharacterized protein n=1 Tax=Lindgomyces ingoldianus TaxID=673940 RepID=A0ACB6QYN9_9PLEO|nr:uncharacterized protein BDR25DRAFT_260781 [Lindgomyces ingoldianus]KAF2471306.1 hypothetical protein BDR25DRAFT_260781 [Lindgomyces ingoldianus]